jgi:hypothetical protein
MSMFLAVNAIFLLVTAELAPAAFGEKTLIVDMKKLRNSAIVLGIMFLATVAITIFNIIFNL